MILGGLEKFSLIDYPGKAAAVVFAAGCNFRCPWCHNPQLVLGGPGMGGPAEREVLAFLERRRGQLQGVVVSGGEPTLQQDLPCFLAEVKAMGYPIKLDTNGSRPTMLERLLDAGLLDFIAMDIKAPLEKYSHLTGVAVQRGDIMASMELIERCGLPYQFRTTVPGGMLLFQDVERIAASLRDRSRYRLQPCTGETMLDPAMVLLDHPDEQQLWEWARKLHASVPQNA